MNPQPVDSAPQPSSPARLSSAHQRTHDAIFRHPAARNLHWRDVRSFLGAVAELAEEPNGTIKVTRGDETLLLHTSGDKDVAEVDEIVSIRRFLERSSNAPAPAAEGLRLLVVIDHRLARVYRTELRGAVPQRIEPYDPHGYGRHLRNVEDHADGQRKPERRSFYEEVARALQGAKQVLLFGSGTGASSAMEQLVLELQLHHHELVDRIVGRIVVDEQHMTEDQLLARAREFYEGHTPTEA